ncbi:conserved hypothetical protein [Alteromonas infernus]
MYTRPLVLLGGTTRVFEEIGLTASHWATTTNIVVRSVHFQPRQSMRTR